MAGNREAMDDLKRILAGRAAFYAKADLTFDTAGKSIARELCGTCATRRTRAIAAGRLAARLIICVMSNILHRSLGH